MNVPANLLKLKHDDVHQCEIIQDCILSGRHGCTRTEIQFEEKFMLEIAHRYKIHTDKKTGRKSKSYTHEIELLNNEIKVSNRKHGPGYIDIYKFKDTNEAQSVFTYITDKTLKNPNVLFESFDDRYWFLFGDIERMSLDVYVRFCNWSLKNNC